MIIALWRAPFRTEMSKSDPFEEVSQKDPLRYKPLFKTAIPRCSYQGSPSGLLGGQHVHGRGTPTRRYLGGIYGRMEGVPWWVGYPPWVYS